MTTRTDGYYSSPSINSDDVVFVSDDDLWHVTLNGGSATRLTANLGRTISPKISPDGKSIAFLGSESGQWEIYTISILGGEARRQTYCGVSQLIGWKNNKILLLQSTNEAPNRGMGLLYELHLDNRTLNCLNVGPATHIRYGKNKSVVLGRNCGDPARWKRYKGGTAGTLWVDTKGNGIYSQILKNINNNLSSPIFLRNTIYFISDHEGIANIYSCKTNGEDLKRLTHHNKYYARNLESDDTHLIYQCGAELYTYNLKTNVNQSIEIQLHTSATQAKPRYVPVTKYLDGFSTSPAGDKICIVTRGRLFLLPTWQGAPVVLGDPDEARYKLPTWQSDGKHIAAAHHEIDGEECLQLFNASTQKFKILGAKIKWGKIWEICPSPVSNQIAVTNNKKELWLINFDTGQTQLVERNQFERLSHLAWSPDGKFLAYSASIDKQRTGIKLYNGKNRQSKLLMTPVLDDWCPTFDANGKYLYFLSVREFAPNYNQTHFDLGFPFAGRPYAVVLNKQSTPPFEQHLETDNVEKEKFDNKVKTVSVHIDFDGIDQRIIPFPVDLGGYHRIDSIKDKVLLLKSEVKPITSAVRRDEHEDPNLLVFSFLENKKELYHTKVKDYILSADRKKILYQSGSRLRLNSVSEIPKKSNTVSKMIGWIDLERIRLRIDPRKEWRQMYREAWILQREHFWNEDMSSVNWETVYERYLPLLDKIKTRAEFSDLLWEMQGELGTSHCYEMHGDYAKKPPNIPTGKLGARYKYKAQQKYFQIEEIFRGDSWIEGSDSPLNAPGVSLKKGDMILAIDGERFDSPIDIHRFLENKAACKVNLSIKRKGKKSEETVVVRTLKNQQAVLYRQWVEENKTKVLKKSKGKLGYIHIPNMGPYGYAEFYRHFLAQCIYDGLIVDVRYNGGGHVSQHILKVLAQQVIGFDQTRWYGYDVYPSYAIPGSIVAVTNEFAGSDGDIFSHAFKLMKIGKLVGKRTWGGVIGINGQYQLKDGTVTTQPEYSFWFKDVGFDVENYGTDPDIEVDITPQDWAIGFDPQLEMAINIGLDELKHSPPMKPDFNKRPNLKLPKLPKIKKV